MLVSLSVMHIMGLLWVRRLRYKAQLCGSVGREVGGEVTAHRIQMWNAVWVSLPCWLLLPVRQESRPQSQSAAPSELLKKGLMVGS